MKMRKILMSNWLLGIPTHLTTHKLHKTKTDWNICLKITTWYISCDHIPINFNPRSLQLSWFQHRQMTNCPFIITQKGTVSKRAEFFNVWIFYVLSNYLDEYVKFIWNLPEVTGLTFKFPGSNSTRKLLCSTESLKWLRAMWCTGWRRFPRLNTPSISFPG